MDGTTLITADDHWALWAILISTAAFGLWAEKTRWGSRLSGAVVAIGTTFVLSNARLIPFAAPAYDAVWSYFVPLAIPLLLFKADLRRILRESGPTLIAFVAGAVGTVLGTVAAFHLIPLGPEGHKIAGIFCATYIGGSVNYVASSEALALRSGDLLTAGIAADNLVMTLYFLLLFSLPSVAWLRRRFVDRSPAGTPVEPGETVGQGNPVEGISVREVAVSLGIAAVLCAVGYGVADALEWRSGAILIVTALAVALAGFFPRQMGGLQGAQEAGIVFMMIFFAVLGATANIGVVLRTGPVLFVFAAFILLVHLAVILAAGKLLRLDLVEIVIASNANMGGPTTAAAMATARNWTWLVTPAILCGTLGYAMATFIGTAVGLWLG
jgi:uncharacterized membrane protein